MPHAEIRMERFAWGPKFHDAVCGALPFFLSHCLPTLPSPLLDPLPLQPSHQSSKHGGAGAEVSSRLPLTAKRSCLGAGHKSSQAAPCRILALAELPPVPRRAAATQAVEEEEVEDCLPIEKLEALGINKGKPGLCCGTACRSRTGHNEAPQCQPTRQPTATLRPARPCRRHQEGQGCRLPQLPEHADVHQEAAGACRRAGRREGGSAHIRKRALAASAPDHPATHTPPAAGHQGIVGGQG